MIRCLWKLTNFIDDQEYKSRKAFTINSMFTDPEQQNDVPMYPILCI